MARTGKSTGKGVLSKGVMEDSYENRQYKKLAVQLEAEGEMVRVSRLPVC